nr:MAG TPA: hypothetical protein [Caudoviricetes sp.]
MSPILSLPFHPLYIHIFPLLCHTIGTSSSASQKG